MNTNTVQVIEKFGEKLDQYLGALANQAGVAADHFYPVFVRQQAVEGWAAILIFLLLSTVAFFLLKMGVKYMPTVESVWKNSNEVKSISGFTSGGILGLVLLITLLVEGTTVLGKVVNPEYSAVKSLVEMVR